jgi:phosphoribosyl 1,2-cyclic phosphodiesterase
MVSLTVLASGSKGNSSVLATSRTCILVDCGLSCRETLRRMIAAGEDPLKISAIVISHEHSDHVNGLWVLARRLNVPVYMTGATYAEWQYWARDKETRTKPHLDRIEIFHAGKAFTIGDVTVSPFTIPHDAIDPVGFTFRAEGVKIGIVTDLGYMPRSVMDNICGCDGLMIESNHDLEMLRGGPYPWQVKQRVMSRTGHLSNAALAQFFSSDYDGSAAFLVLAHLSEANNHPDLARSAAEQALASRQDLLRNRLTLASQHAPLAPIRL